MDGDTRGDSPAVLNTASQLCGLLHATNAKVIGRWDRVLRQYGLDFAGYAVLLAVYERSPVGENELALRLQFDPYTFEDALTDLERCRLISRSGGEGAADRLVEPSRKAVDLRQEMFDISARLACDFNFAEADAKQLMAQLRRLSLAVTDSGLSRVAGERASA
jgi:DNA-binding MarR family transcriptional regulator